MGRQRLPLDTDTWKGRVAARLLELREKKFSTPDDFAEALTDAGLSSVASRIRSWENANRVPSLLELPIIADVLGVSVRSVLPKE